MRLPTISGGKLVTGTLNGGGPEISVSTMNGEIHATVAQLQGDKPLSFTSMNGPVLVRIPADASQLRIWKVSSVW